MNLNALNGVKESIAADPDFHMGLWTHCIGGHMCRVAGYKVERRCVADRLTSVSIDSLGNERDTRILAHELLGVPLWDERVHSALFYSGVRSKERAYELIDEFIAKHSPKQQVKELAEELVEV